jgi:hypothetical protein
LRGSSGTEGGLLDASRRPRTIHHLNPSAIERVIQLRQQHGWCGEAISARLGREGVEVSNGSVYKILHDHALPVKAYAPGRRRTYTRFQRAHPDSLWQTDIKCYSREYLIAFLDDCCKRRLAAYVGDTTVDIDLERRTIIHRCPIWAKSISEKKLCPHVARVFLMVDPERARTLLASIRSSLSDWKFESKLAVEFPT